jgi:hypothetical protein
MTDLLSRGSSLDEILEFAKDRSNAVIYKTLLETFCDYDPLLGFIVHRFTDNYGKNIDRERFALILSLALLSRSEDWRKTVASDMVREYPTVVIKITQDGNQKCALIGDNLVTGTAGFGDTAGEALDQLEMACAHANPPIEL